MTRRLQDIDRNAIITVRIILGYLCLVVIFGTILLMVQSSIEVKSASYRKLEMAIERNRLNDDIRHLDRQIMYMERYDRIESMLDEHLPFLGKPVYPAIEIPVDGLTEYGNRPVAPAEWGQRNWFSRMRNGIDIATDQVQRWMRALVE